MPDMKREYVVEKFVQGLGTSLIPDTWMSIHATDDQDDAVKYAKEQKAATGTDHRVRQFWVESFAPAHTAPTSQSQPPSPEVEMTEVHCMDHTDQCLKVYASGVMPRCPVCRKSMVAVGSLELDDTVMDLT